MTGTFQSLIYIWRFPWVKKHSHQKQPLQSFQTLDSHEVSSSRWLRQTARLKTSNVTIEQPPTLLSVRLLSPNHHLFNTAPDSSWWWGFLMESTTWIYDSYSTVNQYGLTLFSILFGDFESMTFILITNWLVREPLKRGIRLHSSGQNLRDSLKTSQWTIFITGWALNRPTHHKPSKTAILDGFQPFMRYKMNLKELANDLAIIFLLSIWGFFCLILFLP